MPIDITLAKAKYRNRNARLLRGPEHPPEGTWVYNSGNWKSKSMNAGSKAKQKVQGVGVRRRAYGPW